MTNAAFKLQDSGFTRAQVEALSDFLDGRSATKTDLKELEMELKGEMNVIRIELKWTRWMVGVCIALIVAVLVKLLF